MVSEERFFFRQYPHGVITSEMKELSHSDLLEYAGQMYRRLDRIIEIMNRQRTDPEVNHTIESLMYSIGRQADTRFDRRCLGYELQLEDYEDA